MYDPVMHGRAKQAVTPVERWVWTTPLWLLVSTVLVAATVIHGYEWSTNMPEMVRLMGDPFTANPDVGGWLYSSPLGPWLAWLVNARSPEAIALVHYTTTIICVAVATAAVWRWCSDFAARLFVLAYFCSPQSWAGTAYLGLFDIITVAGVTVCMVGPMWATLAAGTAVGVNHFEQGAFALVAVAVINVVVRRVSWRPMIGAFVGLAAGKLIVVAYQWANDLPMNARAEFIREHGYGEIVDGWWGRQFLTLEWAVYNVLWVGVIWMLYQMRTVDRRTVIGLHLFLTVPVLLTFDLSRVYRTVTWPLIVLLVVFAAEWPDRRLVQRSAVVLCLAAVFVPRTEIWWGGMVLN